MLPHEVERHLPHGCGGYASRFICGVAFKLKAIVKGPFLSILCSCGGPRPDIVLGVPLSHAPARHPHVSTFFTTTPSARRNRLAIVAHETRPTKLSLGQPVLPPRVLRTDNSGVVLCSPESRSLESDYELYQHATDSIDYARCAFGASGP